MTTQPVQYCTFYLDGMLFGVEVARVQEVIRYQPMTPVPLTASVIRGLINLRGQIVTAVDLRRLLGLPERASEQLPMNVVVRTDEEPISLLVDEIGEVIEKAEACDPPPPTLPTSSQALIRGVYQLAGRLLLLLNLDKTLQIDAELMS